MIGRATLHIVRIVVWLVTGLAVLAALAVWRLTTGPVALTALTPYLAQALDAAASAAGQLRTSVGDTVLTWGGLHHPFELRLIDVKVTGDASATVATIPELAVGLSVRGLVLGRLVLTRVALIRPTVHLERTADGRLVLDLNGPDRAGAPPALVVLPPPEAAAGPGPLAVLLDALRPPTDPLSPLGALSQVSVVGAALTLEDHVANISWSMPRADLDASRDDGGLHAKAHLEAALAGRTATLEAGAQVTPGGAISTTLQLKNLDAAALVPLVPGLAPFAAGRGPLSAGLDAGFAGGRLTLNRAEVALADGALTITAGGTLEGSLAAPLGALHVAILRGGHTARLDAAVGPATAGSTATLRLVDLEPSLFAGLAPELAPLVAAALPVGGTVTLALEASGLPSHALVELAAGPGRLIPPAGAMPEPVPIRSIGLKLDIDRPLDDFPARLDIHTLAVDLMGPTLVLDGTVERAGDRMLIKGGVKAHGMPAATLAKLWPYKVGKNARDWVTTNITAGMVDAAWISVDGSAPLDDPSEILATTLDGGLDASNLTVSYFKTLAPITGISGHATSDGRDFILNTTGGKILDMTVGPARIDISKLDTPQEWIDIDAPLSGSLRSALAVLDTPPLRYAHRVDIDPAKTIGNQTCRLRFYFPLKKSIDIENVEIHADGQLHGAAIQGLAGGLDATDGELKLALDNTGMDVTGTVRLEGVPAAVQWRENFLDAADPSTKVTLKAELGEAEFAKRGIHLAPYVGGSLGAEVKLAVDRKKRTSVTGSLDLKRATLALPWIDWEKAAGAPGSARFAVGFDKDKPARLSDLTLDAGGLKAAGYAELVPATGALDRIVLSDFRLGANNARAEVRMQTDGGYEIAVHGASLDVRPLLKSSDDPAQKAAQRRERLATRGQPKPPGPHFDLSVQLDRLVTGDQGRALTGVMGRLRNNGTGWDTIELNAKAAGSTAGLTVRYVPEGAKRRLLVTSDDLGTILHALDLTETLRGGRLTLTGIGEPGIPARPVSAQLVLESYRVVNAPLLARLLNALSVTGLMELLNGEGLNFDRLAGDLTLKGDLVTLDNLRTSGGALGLTASGEVDLAADTLTIEGTIVPVYSLNRIVGMIPLLGDLLSGGEGQGIFAATYYLKGPTDQPDVSVNPLAVLAPGFLRNLFFLK